MKIDKLIDNLTRKEAKKIYIDFLKQNEMISKNKLTNLIMNKKFYYFWKEFKSKNVNLTEYVFRTFLDERCSDIKNNV